jgi:hypothetical protein
MLADLGADVIKIERPGAGDDTRGFAPPYMPGTRESAYFIGVNRNKRSVTLDIARPEGQAIAQQLIAQCDILVENFKVGALAKYGLGYEELHRKYPRLIYCSITGFGQTGPYAPRPGYDSLIQAMGGVMSLTGEPDGLPQKVGVPVAICSPDCMAASVSSPRCGIAMRRDRDSRSTSACWIMHVAWLAIRNELPGDRRESERLGNSIRTSCPIRCSPPPMATSFCRSATIRHSRVLRGVRADLS